MSRSEKGRRELMLWQEKCCLYLKSFLYLKTAGRQTVTPPASALSVYTEISGRAAAKDMMLSAKKIFINCEKSVEEKS